MAVRQTSGSKWAEPGPTPGTTATRPPGHTGVVGLLPAAAAASALRCCHRPPAPRPSRRPLSRIRHPPSSRPCPPPTALAIVQRLSPKAALCRVPRPTATPPPHQPTLAPWSTGGPLRPSRRHPARSRAPSRVVARPRDASTVPTPNANANATHGPPNAIAEGPRPTPTPMRRTGHPTPKSPPPNAQS